MIERTSSTYSHVVGRAVACLAMGLLTFAVPGVATAQVTAFSDDFTGTANLADTNWSFLGGGVTGTAYYSGTGTYYMYENAGGNDIAGISRPVGVGSFVIDWTVNGATSTGANNGWVLYTFVKNPTSGQGGGFGYYQGTTRLNTWRWNTYANSAIQSFTNVPKPGNLQMRMIWKSSASGGGTWTLFGSGTTAPNAPPAMTQMAQWTAAENAESGRTIDMFVDSYNGSTGVASAYLNSFSILPSVSLASSGTLNFGTVITGGSFSSGAISVQENTGLYSAAVNIGAAPAGFTVGGAGTTGTVAASGTNTYAVTLGTGAVGAFSGSVSLTSGPSNTDMNRAVTLSGTVLGHAAPSLTTGTLALGIVHAGYASATSGGSLTVTNGTTGGLYAPLGGSATPSNSISLSSVSGVEAGQNGSITASLAAGRGAGTISEDLTYTFADDSALSGASANVGTATIRVTGGVFSGTASWTTDGGGSWGTQGEGVNWTSAEGVAAAPGTFAGFANTDRATFGSAVTGGTATILLDGATPSLAALAFANTAARYVIGQGSGGSLTLAASGGQPTIDVVGSHEIAVPIAGSGGFRKTGAGALTVSATQTLSGGVTVAAGSLVLGVANLLPNATRIDVLQGASIDATSAGLTVGDGQTLGGYGTVAGNLTLAAGSVLAPGGSVGLLTGTAGTTVWNGGTQYQFEVNNADGVAGGPSGWDLFTTSGSLTLSASTENRILLTIASLSGTATGAAANFNQNFNYAWKFAEAGSPIGFDLSWFDVVATGFEGLNPTNGSFFVARGDQITAVNLPGFGGGTSSELYVVYYAVPEPATLTLAGIGAVVGGLIGRHRRRRRQRA